jgi:hypothetical protein
LVAVRLALRGGSEPTAAEPARPQQAAVPPPPKSQPPPATAAKDGSPPDVKVESANVIADLACGVLDGGKLQKNGSVFLWGWAYDPRDYTPAVAVILVDNGRQLTPSVRVLLERPDVAAFKKNPQLLVSGWNVSLPASQLPGGQHVFEAFAILTDQKLGRLRGKITIEK